MPELTDKWVVEHNKKLPDELKLNQEDMEGLACMKALAGKMPISPICAEMNRVFDAQQAGTYEYPEEPVMLTEKHITDLIMAVREKNLQLEEQ